MAAGEMDVDRRVERDARLAPARDLLGVALGVGGGELAAGIAGAGDEAGADGVGLDGEAERFDPRLRRLELCGRHAGDQQVLPDREPDIAVAQVARDVGEPAHLRDRHAADRQRRRRSSCSPSCFCAMDADMRGAVEGRPRRQRAGHGAVELAAELLLDQRRGISRRPACRARISAAPWCGRCGRRDR